MAPPRAMRLRVAIGVVVACALAASARLAMRRDIVTTDDALVLASTVRVSPEVSARVKRKLIRPHERVERGALLVELDPALFENAVARATGEVHAARAQQRQAEVRLAALRKQRPMRVVAAQGDHAQAAALSASLEADVRRSEAEVASAAAVLEEARQEHGRALALRKTGAVSSAEVDQSATKVARLEAQLGAARAQVEASRFRRTAAGSAERSAGGRASLVETGGEEDFAEADLALAQARLEQAGAELARAEAELARTHVLAPMSGLVEHVGVEEGMLVGPTSVLLSIVSDEDVWIEARVKETEIDRLGPGMRATIQVDALGSRELGGHVEGIGGATLSRFAAIPTEATGAHFVRVTQRVPVRIRLDDKALGLRSGLSAVVSIQARR